MGINKTEQYWKYTLPTNLKPLHKLNVRNYFIEDVLYYEAQDIVDVQCFLFLEIDYNGHFNNDKKIYFDIKKGRKEFKKVIDEVKKDEHFEHDYALDYLGRENHVLVVRVQKQFEQGYFHFLKGEYSKVFTKEQLTEMGHLTQTKKGLEASDVAFKVLRLEKGLEKFKQQLEKEFRINSDKLSEEDLLSREWDTPPLLRNEVLNFSFNSRVKRYLESFVKKEIPQLS